MTEVSPDRIGMRRALFDLGDQMRLAVGSAADTSTRLTSRLGDVVVSEVMLTGMGGSGIAGDIVSAVAAPDCGVPITVVKGYECPAFVGPSTVVLALSFSGDTEETLSVARRAHEAGAVVVAVSSGGTLAQLADEWGEPRYQVDETIPMPRAAVGAMAMPPLLALGVSGLLGDVDHQISAAIAQVDARLASLEDGAMTSHGDDSSLPIVCGAGDLGTTAALRWKTQINENAKIPAVVGTLPELCHNELAGWQVSADLAARVQPWFLRHDYEHPQNVKRFEYYAEVLVGAGVARPIEVTAAGSCPLAQLFDLLVQGDALSLDLAARLGRDPGPVDILTDLKSRLAR